MKKTLIIIGGVIAALFIFGVVLRIVDPGGRIASKKAAKQIEQVEQGIFKETEEYVKIKWPFATRNVAVYTTETNKRKIEKFGERYKKDKSITLVLFFNNKNHVPGFIQLQNWRTGGLAAAKVRQRVYGKYFVACYRSGYKQKNGFQYTEFSTDPDSCGL